MYRRTNWFLACVWLIRVSTNVSSVKYICIHLALAASISAGFTIKVLEWSSFHFGRMTLYILYVCNFYYDFDFSCLEKSQTWNFCLSGDRRSGGGVTCSFFMFFLLGSFAIFHFLQLFFYYYHFYFCFMGVIFHFVFNKSWWNYFSIVDGRSNILLFWTLKISYAGLAPYL